MHVRDTAVEYFELESVSDNEEDIEKVANVSASEAHYLHEDTPRNVPSSIRVAAKEHKGGRKGKRNGSAKDGILHGGVHPHNDVNRLALEALPSLLISVLGLMLAGWLLDVVQHWPVFTKVSELFILVPILLNLKGNLEMNLAARLSTASNLGYLDMRKTRTILAVGNLSLLQLQGLVVGAVAGLFAFLLGLAVHPHPNSWSEVVLMITASMGCAAISSLVLGSFMCALVIVSRKLDINPANIATPLGASLGDLVTLVVLAMFGNMLLIYMNTPLSSFLFAGMLVCIPLWIRMIYRNEYVKDLLNAGWVPIFSAMLISSCAGLILERFIEQDAGMALLSPVFNGIGGNLASIYASRISTALHAGTEEFYTKVELVLFLLNIPCHIIFLLLARILGIGHVEIRFLFFAWYMMASIVFSVIMLKFSKWMTVQFWKRGYDPDNCVLPFLTALGDVVGTTLLVVVFSIYKSLVAPVP